MFIHEMSNVSYRLKEVMFHSPTCLVPPEDNKTKINLRPWHSHLAVTCVMGDQVTAGQL